LSLARACSNFAAAMTPIKAEKKVVANSPAKIPGGQMLVSWIMLGFRRNEWCLVLDAKETITSRYARKVDNIAQSVPRGMALLGLRRSPDMEAPAKIPDVAGKRIPNKSRNVVKPLKWPLEESGRRLDFRVARLNPVNSMPLSGSTKAGFRRAETGILKMEKVSTTKRALLALANMELPARQRPVQKTSATVPNR
jgi:hypothetical protein